MAMNNIAGAIRSHAKVLCDNLFDRVCVELVGGFTAYSPQFDLCRIDSLDLCYPIFE
jgi:hypothetical protein